MRDADEEYIVSFSLASGYIFKNYTQFIHSVRSEQILTFTENEIVCENVTADGHICGRAVMDGTEVGLEWSEEIPVEKRLLSLNFSKNILIAAIPKIKKKDAAAVTIMRCIDRELDDSASAAYLMYFSKSLSQENHQSVERMPYTQALEDLVLVAKEEPVPAKSLSIPIHQFARIVERFREKKSKTMIKVYSKENKNVSIHFSATIYGRGNEMSEYFGQHDDDLEPSCEFEINYSGACILYNMSQMHREGTVHVSYEPGKNLMFYTKFGAFGYCKVYINKEKAKDEV